MLTQEQEFFVRFIFLLLQGGTEVLRCIADKALQKKNLTLRQFLSKHQHALQKSRDLTKKDIKRLYPASPDDPDIKDFDITLLSYLITNFLKGCLEGCEMNAVIKIRQMRNNYSAHAPEAKMTYEAFNKKSTKLKLIIKTVSHAFPEEKRTQLNDLIENIEKDGPGLDINTKIEEIKKFDKSNDFFQSIAELEASVGEIQRVFVEVQLSLQSMLTKSNYAKTACIGSETSKAVVDGIKGTLADSSRSNEIHNYPCKRCSEDGKITEAVMFCLECDENICSDCLVLHNRFPRMRSHQISDFLCAGTEIYKPSMSNQECNEHVGKLINIYCPGHDFVGCAVCVAVSHRFCQGKRYISDIAPRIQPDKEISHLESETKAFLAQLYKLKHQKPLQNASSESDVELFVQLKKRKLSINELKMRMEERFGAAHARSDRFSKSISIKHVSDFSFRLDSENFPGFIYDACLTKTGNIILVDYDNKRIKKLDHSYAVTEYVDVPDNAGYICEIDENQLAVTLHKKVQFVYQQPLNLGKSFSTYSVCRGIDCYNAQLYICCGGYKEDNEGPAHIEVYSLDGDLLRSYYEGLTLPLYIKVSDETFISEFGKRKLRSADMFDFRLSEMEISVLNVPKGICRIGDDQLCIAGYVSNNIVLISQDGSDEQEILTEADGIVRPYTVCFDEKRSHLIVPLGGPDVIKVFKVET